MDRLEELVVFTTILDAGSLAAAARRLRLSPPSVTRSLATLEERIGVRLVERTTRQLAPTDAGRRLAERARQLSADYAEAIGREKKHRNAPLQGLLRITAPTLFGRWHVAPLVARFLDTHPGIRIEMVLTNLDLDLIKERLDAAVRLGPRSDSRFIARRVGHVRRVLFASPDYLARRGRPRTPLDLIKHEIVYYSGRSVPMVWRFRVAGRDRVVRIIP